MDSLYVDLSDAVKHFVDQRVSQEGYRSASEYVHALIQADQDRLARKDLEAEILKGLDSGEAAPMTAEDWQAIREEVRSRYERRMQNQATE